MGRARPPRMEVTASSRANLFLLGSAPESESGSMQEDPLSSSLWLLPGELVQLQV